MKPQIFPCGHPYADNTVSVLNLRCRICSNRRAAAFRSRKAEQREVIRNHGRYEHLADATALEGGDPSVALLPIACIALREALYREHPYVFDAAEKTGRLSVRS